jgi:hypothetical protein
MMYKHTNNTKKICAVLLIHISVIHIIILHIELNFENVIHVTLIKPSFIKFSHSINTDSYWFLKSMPESIFLLILINTKLFFYMTYIYILFYFFLETAKFY